MNLQQLPPYEDGLVHVVIETPAGSPNKYAYDPGTGLFRLKKTLPVGAVFPYHFGFVPHTKGGDGDPVDILVIMEPPVYPGCLVACRLLGVLRAVQKEKGRKPVRNDRFIAVSDSSQQYRHIHKLADLQAGLTREIEHFFVNYNREEGRTFKPEHWRNAKEALKLIRKAAIGQMMTVHA